MALRRSPEQTMSRVLNLLLCLFWYGLLAGDVSWPELAAGVAAAIVVMVYIDAQRGRPASEFRMKVPWRAAKSALRSIVVDSCLVGAKLASSLLRPTGGAIQHQPFRAGNATADDAGRRAAVTLLVSLAPNGFVLDLSPTAGADGMLLHQLVRRPPASDSEWLT